MRRTVDTTAGCMTYDLIHTVQAQVRAVALPGNRVHVYAPYGFSLRQADVLVQQEAETLRARLARLDGPQCVEGVAPGLQEARQCILQRLEYWHARIGGRYGTVTVGDLGIKWGACDRMHNLSFNRRLLLAQPEAQDYVVIHELCHLHEFSHSARFWRMVREQMPEYEAWKKWLSDHKQELMNGPTTD